MRFKAVNPRGSREYFEERYTVQHFFDWAIDSFKQAMLLLFHMYRHLTSPSYRMRVAREYNQLMFGHIPTEQIVVFDEDGHSRPLRPEERTWPE
jgi:hypothetical protein